MKKKLVLFAVIAVAAVAACAGLFLLTGSTPAALPDTDDTARTIIDKPVDSLKAISVLSGADKWEAYVDENGELVLAGLEDYPLNADEITKLREYACLIRSQEVIKANTDLAEYGLDDAHAVSVRIEYADGEICSFKLGSSALGVSSESVYALYNGEVCLMYRLHVAPFLQKSGSYVNNVLTPSNDHADYILVYLSVSDVSEAAPLVISYDKAEATGTGQYMSSYKMLSPKECSITYSEKSSAFMQSVFGMSAEIVDVSPTDEDLTLYGLAKPPITLQAAFMNADGQSYTLQISASEPDADGFSFLMLSGRDIIYRYNIKQAAWYTTDWEDVIGKQIIMPSIKEVAELNITRAGDTHCISSEYLNDALNVTLDGEPYSADEYKKLYQVIILSELDELSEVGETADGSAEIEIEFVYNSQNRDRISFVEASIRQYAVFKNGELLGYTRVGTVEAIARAFDSFLRGEAIEVIY